MGTFFLLFHGEKIPISDEMIIGRYSPFLMKHSDDKRVSRKHVQVSVAPSGTSVVVSHVGTNPGQIWSAKYQNLDISKGQPMVKKEQILLSPGDRFSLVLEDHVFEVGTSQPQATSQKTLQTKTSSFDLQLFEEEEQASSHNTKPLSTANKNQASSLFPSSNSVARTIHTSSATDVSRSLIGISSSNSDSKISVAHSNSSSSISDSSSGVSNPSYRVSNPSSSISNSSSSVSSLSSLNHQAKKSGKEEEDSILKRAKVETQDEDTKKKVCPKPANKVLSFPALAISLKYDLSHAAVCFVAATKDFLQKNSDPAITLVLIDSQQVIDIFQKKWKDEGINDERMGFKVGEVRNQRDSSFLVFQSSWRLKPTTINKDVFTFGNSAVLQELIRHEHPQPAQISECFAIPLSDKTPFKSQRSVDYLICAVPPNNDPLKPDFINNDFAQGDPLLRKTWANLFRAFLECIQE